MIELRCGALIVTLAPDAGGSIAGFDIIRDGARLALLRPASAEALAANDARGMASFPLAPYSNRIELGWMGLKPSHPSFPLPIHGDAWLRPWLVEEAGDRSATLVYRHDGGFGWPHAYLAKQHFHLDEAGLRIDLTLHNRSGKAMPAGLGWHPYFHRTPDTVIRATTGSVWLNGPDMLPRERVAVPGQWRLDPARPVEGLALDNCFAGWDGSAEIVWPERSIALRMQAEPPLRHLVVYTPTERDYFCMEPVSHCNNGFALAERGTPDTGTIILAPDGILTARVAFQPRLLAD